MRSLIIAIAALAWNLSVQGQIILDEISTDLGTAISYQKSQFLEARPLIGLHAGINADFEFFKQTDIRFSLQYVQKGNGIKVNITNMLGQPISSFVSYNYYSYLNTGIINLYKLGQQERLKLGGGIFFSYLLGVTQINSPEQPNVPKKIKYNVDMFKRYDSGILAHAAYDLIHKESRALRIGLQFQYSFIPVAENLSNPQFNRSNRSLHVFLNYAIQM
ncbi:hypothetical protein GYB22_01270 [bacterium]|nr:hypothetical protein [bacterium]